MRSNYAILPNVTSSRIMAPQMFRTAYFAAHYKVGDLNFRLSPTPTHVTLFDGTPFALITAHNPRSEILSKEENAQRHAQLVDVVAELGLEYKVAVGKSVDSSWQEKSLAIFDLSLERALGLGKQFAQHAILFAEADKVGLVWCESGEVEWRYPRILVT